MAQRPNFIWIILASAACLVIGKTIFGLILFCVLAYKFEMSLMTGILIGRYWTKSKEYVYEQEVISALLKDEINPTNIDAYLK